MPKFEKAISVSLYIAGEEHSGSAPLPDHIGFKPNWLDKWLEEKAEELSEELRRRYHGVSRGR